VEHLVSPDPYDLLAHEYYDAAHKTCRNFDQTTVAALAIQPPVIPKGGLVLEVGCGRGRCEEFLGITAKRVVQLDSSERMLNLRDREDCLLKVHADAARIPLASSQFSAVVGFLADPFMGLAFFCEAFRLLRDGVLLLTTPSYEWGTALRGTAEPERSEARFVNRESHILLVPSILIPEADIRSKLDYCGFVDISVSKHPLPATAAPVSPDVQRAATLVGLSVHEIPLLYLVSARRGR
jgi:SAM-dependent methyltransferase